MSRVLFVLKSRESSWGYSGSYASSGLSNSVRFVVDMLNQRGIEARAVEVDDNNDIDREVTAYQPTHAILEAFWVVPEKFDVLKPLHPRVRWIVRNHSETPFLSSEGIAFEWVIGYLRRGVEVMCNSPRSRTDMRDIAAACGLPEALVTSGPNFYPMPGAGTIQSKPHGPARCDVACFGAIRPLKNQLSQAVAALAFADAAHTALRFHVNATRIEGSGDPILKNLRALFAATPDHELVEHGWLPHPEFLRLMASMDISMQVAFSETFNIVTADAMACSVPIVASPEVPWIRDYAQVDPTSTKAMMRKLLEIWNEGIAAHSARLHRQRHDLIEYDRNSEAVWLERFGS